MSKETFLKVIRIIKSSSRPHNEVLRLSVLNHMFGFNALLKPFHCDMDMAIKFLVIQWPTN